MCAIFQKNDFKQMVEESIETLSDKQLSNYINECLNKLDEYVEGVDYTQVLDIRRKRMQNRYKNDILNSVSNPFKNK